MSKKLLDNKQEINCKLCNSKFKVVGKLTEHLRLRHNIDSVDYTIKYLLDNKIPKCKCGCAQPVKVHNYKYNEWYVGHTHVSGTIGRIKSSKLYDIKYDSSKWILNCTICNEVIQYNDYYKFRSAIGRIQFKNQILKCQTCRYKVSKKGGPIKKFTETDSDWIIQCDGKNDCVIVCKNYRHYRDLNKKKENNKKVLCRSCCQVGKIITDEFRNKCKGKHISDETRHKLSLANKRRYANQTLEDKLRIKEIQSNANLKAWKNATPEQRANRLKNRNIAISNLPPEKIKAKKEKISAKLLQRRLANGVSGFYPAFNIQTIPYIEDILNVTFNTKFIHAKTEAGEFHIYDKEFKKFYYADAYSKELNLWIEFDEKHHYDSNKELKQECQLRESRIRSILKCRFIRIPFLNYK